MSDVDGVLNFCKACDGPCEGDFCSDDCAAYWETRDQPL